MAQPPIKTTADDISALSTYLRNQVGWTEIGQVKKAIPPGHADNRKLEAMRYLGLLERDAGNIKLGSAGRRYAEASTDEARAEVLRSQLQKLPLYHQTLEWMHYNAKKAPTKTDIANHWHDNHGSEIADAKGAALTDAAIFFLRVAGLAGLGQFVAAGGGRDTHIKVNGEALENYVTGPAVTTPEDSQQLGNGISPPSPPPPPGPSLTLGTGLHVNIEIHIAADAEAATIEEIFKNMRRYILTEPKETETS